MLGHRDITTTFRIYSHLTPEGREDVAERRNKSYGLQKLGSKLRSSTWKVLQIGRF
jgi:hypothetical protein